MNFIIEAVSTKIVVISFIKIENTPHHEPYDVSFMCYRVEASLLLAKSNGQPNRVRRFSRLTVLEASNVWSG